MLCRQKLSRTLCWKNLPTALETADQSGLPLCYEEIKEIPEATITTQVAGDDPAKVAEINWEDYANNFDSDFSFARETPPADAPSQFDFISQTPGLISHLSMAAHPSRAQ